MSTTFVIGDIHGRFDLLEASFEAIAKFNGSDPHKIILLGDYIDRGKQSRQVIEFLMAAPDNVMCLMGNHEQMLTMTADNPLDANWWLSNGGDACLRSYGVEVQRKFDGRYHWVDIKETIPAEHLKWMRNLPMLHFDPHRVFVHACVDPNKPLAAQREEVLLWARYPAGADVGHDQRHVIHGHTPNEHGPERFINRTNIDTGAVWNGRQVIAVFDDDRPGAPVTYLEVVRGHDCLPDT